MTSLPESSVQRKELTVVKDHALVLFGSFEHQLVTLRLNSTAHDGTVTSVESHRIQRKCVERTSVLRLSAVFLIKASAGRNQG